jgi:hypothetical protein
MLEETEINAHHVEVPSWRPNPAVINEAITALDNISFQDSSLSLFVIHNLDNAAYYAMTEEGDLIPSRRLEGHYHLDGSLVIASKEQFRFTLKTCLPLFNYKPEICKIVLSPMPRYWVGKCCGDAEHIPNFHDQDYEKTMFDGLFNLMRAIKD